MSLDISVVYYGRNTSVADTMKGKADSNSEFTSHVNEWGHNVSAEVQRHSPLTDLKEGRNELDWQRLFFFSFESSDICGVAGAF